MPDLEQSSFGELVSLFGFRESTDIFYPISGVRSAHAKDSTDAFCWISESEFAAQTTCGAFEKNLHTKYVTTAHNIQQRRNTATAERKGFLKELGYA